MQTALGMHPRAFGNLVDDLLVLAQREDNDIHGLRRPLRAASRDREQVITKKLPRCLDQAERIDAVFLCYILKS
jgi:hypothetical protein